MIVNNIVRWAACFSAINYYTIVYKSVTSKQNTGTPPKGYLLDWQHNEPMCKVAESTVVVLERFLIVPYSLGCELKPVRVDNTLK